MLLKTVDVAIILGYFSLALAIGVFLAKRAGGSSSEFFLSMRKMPWWLLGFSMVATTFSTDTPNLVTSIVRTNGVAGNWIWWAFLITGMVTVFIYSKLWRRLGVMTDLEFYEMRYSGRIAAFLRGFRALYLGVFFNIMIMATVSLAAIKIGGVMLGLQPIHCVVWALLVTVIFSSLGGFKGVVWTDFILFILAMTGAFAAAVIALDHPEVGGLTGLVDKFGDPNNTNLAGKLDFIPEFDFSNSHTTELVVSIFIIPLAVQWWSVWYPGAEPGGGGYLAQRMLAAKSENHALSAVLFFNIAHYALRPWPWIIVALCSLIVFPDLASIRTAFPDADPSIISNDTAYPAMLTFLRPGWLGLVLTSLIAAYMSTISTHLNWGSSYIVNDWYKRFVKPKAKESELVWVGRLSTVIMVVIVALVSLAFKDALQWFQIMLQVGAGTGLIFILRWFWWRVNPMSELVAMITSFLVAVVFFIQHKLMDNGILDLVLNGTEQSAAEAQITKHFYGLAGWQELVIGVAATTVCWVVTAFITKPSDEKTLLKFVALINPGGPGWKPIYKKLKAENIEVVKRSKYETLPRGILATVTGCIAVYSFLFSTGYFLFANYTPAIILGVIAIITTALLYKLVRSTRSGTDIKTLERGSH